MFKQGCAVTNTGFEDNLAQATCPYTTMKYSAMFLTALHLVIKASTNFCTHLLTDKPLCEIKKKSHHKNQTQTKKDCLSVQRIFFLSQI